MDVSSYSIAEIVLAMSMNYFLVVLLVLLDGLLWAQGEQKRNVFNVLYSKIGLVRGMLVAVVVSGVGVWVVQRMPVRLGGLFFMMGILSVVVVRNAVWCFHVYRDSRDENIQQHDVIRGGSEQGRVE
jgi:hypothetical protein